MTSSVALFPSLNFLLLFSAKTNKTGMPKIIRNMIYGPYGLNFVKILDEIDDNSMDFGEN